jgi:hypothetical protein
VDEQFLVERVKPFYLGMMGLNGIRADAARIAAIRAAGRSVSVDEASALLRSDWRPRVMGAWYALLHDADLLADELGGSLATSLGTLTAPPLATVATLMLGEGALPSLAAYAAAAAANPYLGADGFIAAAIEHLGGKALADANDLDREHLSMMLTVAGAIKGR